MAVSAQRIDFAIVHDWRCSRPSRISEIVGTFLFMFPKNFAIGFVQAEHPFAAGNFAALERIAGVRAFRSEQAVGDVHTALGNCRPGIAAANRSPPLDRRAVRRKFLDDSRFAPDAITLRTEPLRPIAGIPRRCKKREGGEDQPALWKRAGIVAL